MLISMIVFVVLAILAAYVASNNLTPVDMNLLGYALHAPSGVLFVSALGLGFLLGVLLMLPVVISRSWALIRTRRKIQDIQDMQDLELKRKKEAMVKGAGQDQDA
jgi:uncharacterized integral membrane protein